MLRMKELKFKITIALLSTILSIFLVELLINNYLKRYSSTVVYNESKEYYPPHYTQLFDDAYESYHSTYDDYQVITLGDSYTNGGNVRRKETYPDFLFNLLGERVDVINMGLCEDTTQGSYKRLAQYLDNTTKKPIVIQLVGAADIFIDFRFESAALDSYYKEIQKFPLKDNEIHLNFLKDLKFIKLAKYIYYNQLEKFKLITARKDVYFDEISKCFHQSFDEKCTDTFILKYQKEILESRENLNVFITEVIFLAEEFKDKKYSVIVNVILKLIDRNPQILIYREVVHNLIAFTNLQQEYSVDEIFEFVNVKILRESNFIEKNSSDTNDPDHYDNIMKGLKIWKSNKELISLNRRREIERIVELVKEKNGHIILMTYPLPYKDVNNDIRQIAKLKNISLIDLENIFNEPENKKLHLISDWEHCTPKGYELIALKVKDEIDKYIRKNE